MDMGFSDLYEMYEDFRLNRARTTPADFERHLVTEERYGRLDEFAEWVQDNYPDVCAEFDARS